MKPPSIPTLCNALLTFMACATCVVVAVLLLGSLSRWLVDQAGEDGRAVLALANAPWFARDSASLQADAPRATRVDPPATAASRLHLSSKPVAP